MSEQTQLELNLDAWDSGNVEVPKDKLDQLDDLIKELALARARKDDIEADLNIANANVKVIEDKVRGALKSANRDSFKTPGAGMVSIVHRQNFTTPKSNAEKADLFNYINTKYGGAVLKSMLSIHSATLNSWAKKEIESGTLNIPGLGQPTSTEILSFRREIV